jgi:hypothetical protein
MIKYTKTTLEKIERIFHLIGYKVRYEKGNFNSGYCIVENNKVVVVNKFFELPARIDTLREILIGMEVNETLKGSQLEKFYLQLFDTVQSGTYEAR